MNTLELIEGFLILILALPMALAVSIILTLNLRGLQFRSFFQGVKYLFTKEETEAGSISNFEAIATVLAGNLGTGNISGMAIALESGGPAALCWMWIFTFLTMIVKYSGCLLAIKYRIETSDHRFLGGPMYYMEHGLGSKLLAIIFSIAAIAGSFTIGNWTQVHSLITPLQDWAISPFLLSIVLSLAVGFVIIGKVESIAKIAATVVPFMAICYLLSSLTILAIYSDQLIPSLKLIFSHLLSPSSIIHGSLGFTLSQILQTALARAVFATDAGIGIAPILQASARTKDPVEEGLVAMVAPIIVMFMCTATMLVLLVTDSTQFMPQASGTALCMLAFKKGLGSQLGPFVVIISLLFFAFTTILAWWFCLERVTHYLLGDRFLKPIKILFLLSIPLSIFFKQSFVWHWADFSIALMLITNLIALFKLRKQILTITSCHSKTLKR